MQRAHCAICTDRIWGLGRQGYKCINCKLLVHKKCHKLVTIECGRHSLPPVRLRELFVIFVCSMLHLTGLKQEAVTDLHLRRDSVQEFFTFYLRYVNFASLEGTVIKCHLGSSHIFSCLIKVTIFHSELRFKQFLIDASSILFKFPGSSFLPPVFSLEFYCRRNN